MLDDNRSDWVDRTIGSLGTVVTGKTPKTSMAECFGGSTPFITPSDLNGDRYVESTARCLSEQGVAAVKGAQIRAGSVLVSCIGSDMGKAAITPVDATTNQQINTIIVEDPAVDSLFVYYDLSSRKAELHQLGSGGSTLPIVNKTSFSAIRIWVPPLVQQRAIASILSAFDDKIELNRRTAATLEEMARAVFKSWFVDFGPVRAKAEGRQPDWMDAETAALFPDSFGDDGLPEGWMAVAVSDVASIHKDIVKPAEHPDEVFAHMSLPAFDAGRRPVLELGSAIKSNKTGIAGGCVLVSKLNPRIPRIWLVPTSSFRRIASTEFVCLLPADGFTTYWLWAAVSQPLFLERMTGQVTGTSGSHQRVRPSDILAASLGGVESKTAAAFEMFIGPMISRVLQLEGETVQLAKLRDTLLPCLLSGEIRVGDAEKIAEGAL